MLMMKIMIIGFIIIIIFIMSLHDGGVDNTDDDKDNDGWC